MKSKVPPEVQNLINQEILSGNTNYARELAATFNSPLVLYHLDLNQDSFSAKSDSGYPAIDLTGVIVEHVTFTGFAGIIKVARTEFLKCGFSRCNFQCVKTNKYKDNYCAFKDTYIDQSTIYFDGGKTAVSFNNSRLNQTRLNLRKDRGFVRFHGGEFVHSVLEARAGTKITISSEIITFCIFDMRWKSPNVSEESELIFKDSYIDNVAVFPEGKKAKLVGKTRVVAPDPPHVRPPAKEIS